MTLATFPLTNSQSFTLTVHSRCSNPSSDVGRSSDPFAAQALSVFTRARSLPPLSECGPAAPVGGASRGGGVYRSTRSAPTHARVAVSAGPWLMNSPVRTCFLH